MAVLGTPSERDEAIIEDERAVGFLHRIDHSDGVPLGTLYPQAAAPLVDLLTRLLKFHPADRADALAALRHEWLAELHEESDLEGVVPCDFAYESCDLHLDHFLLASLDAVHAAHPTYPVHVPEMVRFGIMHNRSVTLSSDDGGEAAEGNKLLEWEDSTPPSTT